MMGKSDGNRMKASDHARRKGRLLEKMFDADLKEKMNQLARKYNSGLFLSFGRVRQRLAALNPIFAGEGSPCHPRRGESAEYRLAGCVQHRASTLPEEAFDMFPKVCAAEIHLATGFQNIIYDSSFLPKAFREAVYGFIKGEFFQEKKEGQTEEQFLYSTRKKALGPFKKSFGTCPFR
jgi:hypothetical protein